MDWVKIIQCYIENRNYLSKGLSVIYDFKNIAQFSVITIGILKYVGWIGNFFVGVAALTLVMILSCWLIGRIWDKKKFWSYEIEWQNKRNPFVEQMLKK